MAGQHVRRTLAQWLASSSTGSRPGVFTVRDVSCLQPFGFYPSLMLREKSMADGQKKRVKTKIRYLLMCKH
ncbi:hypothetical protein ACVMB2_005433 [Sinorhizobium meliloti]